MFQFDILRGWAVFYFSGVIGHGGRSRRGIPVSKDLKGRCRKNTFFQVDNKAIGGS
jgi:hypothetical protein